MIHRPHHSSRLAFLFPLLFVASCIGNGSSAKESDPTSAAALRADVEFLTTMDPQRSFGNPDALERAATYIEADFRAAGARVERQVFEIDGERYSNVIAHFGPQDGARLVIGAHYDSYGDLPGADDNASGTAALMALAHEIADLDLAQPVEFVAYTLEEPPQFASGEMGSARHAQRLANDDAELLGMICLEMLGFYIDEDDSQAYPVEGMELMFGTRADFLAVVGRTEDAALIGRVHALMQGDGLRVVQFAAPGPVQGIDLSDHRNYWEAGYEAVMITDTSFFRNPHYHQDTDTADTLDYARMEIAVDRLREVVQALAEITRMEPRHVEALNTRAVARPWWMRVALLVAVAANLALLGYSIHGLWPAPPVEPFSHPIERGLAGENENMTLWFSILIAVCLADLVALWSMRRRTDPGPVVHVWALVGLFIAPYVLPLWLAVGKALVSIALGTSDDFAMKIEAPYVVWPGMVGYVATLVGLRAWMAWRPAWWMFLLLFTPIVVVQLAFIHPPVLTFIETLIYGPPPPDSAGFGASMDYYHEIGDPSEWMLPLGFVCWLVLFLAGALRRLAQIADQRERERQLGIPEPHGAATGADPA